MVFSFELRRRGDLWGTAATAFATGPAGETWLDYVITVRNAGTDVVPASIVDELPAGVGLVSVKATQGGCVTVDAGARLRCSLGAIPPGFDHGARIAIRVSYDCASSDPIGRSSIVMSSPAGDIDLSNNITSVNELDRVCPDPFFDAAFPPDDPLPPDDPFPSDDPFPPADPGTSPGDPGTPPGDPGTPPGDPGTPPADPGTQAP
jgi:uncharacterized repeat protein (TIGR01451 family)